MRHPGYWAAPHADFVVDPFGNYPSKAPSGLQSIHGSSGKALQTIPAANWRPSIPRTGAPGYRDQPPRRMGSAEVVRQGFSAAVVPNACRPRRWGLIARVVIY